MSALRNDPTRPSEISDVSASQPTDQTPQERRVSEVARDALEKEPQLQGQPQRKSFGALKLICFEKALKEAGVQFRFSSIEVASEQRKVLERIFSNIDSGDMESFPDKVLEDLPAPAEALPRALLQDFQKQVKHFIKGLKQDKETSGTAGSLEKSLNEFLKDAFIFLIEIRSEYALNPDQKNEGAFVKTVAFCRRVNQSLELLKGKQFSCVQKFQTQMIETLMVWSLFMRSPDYLVIANVSLEEPENSERVRVENLVQYAIQEIEIIEGRLDFLEMSEKLTTEFYPFFKDVREKCRNIKDQLAVLDQKGEKVLSKAVCKHIRFLVIECRQMIKQCDATHQKLYSEMNKAEQERDQAAVGIFVEKSAYADEIGLFAQVVEFRLAPLEITDWEEQSIFWAACVKLRYIDKVPELISSLVHRPDSRLNEDLFPGIRKEMEKEFRAVVENILEHSGLKALAEKFLDSKELLGSKACMQAIKQVKLDQDWMWKVLNEGKQKYEGKVKQVQSKFPLSALYVQECYHDILGSIAEIYFLAADLQALAKEEEAVQLSVPILEQCFLEGIKDDSIKQEVVDEVEAPPSLPEQSPSQSPMPSPLPKIAPSSVCQKPLISRKVKQNPPQLKVGMKFSKMAQLIHKYYKEDVQIEEQSRHITVRIKNEYVSFSRGSRGQASVPPGPLRQVQRLLEQLEDDKGSK